jgi:DNA-binding MarR family transcriptional regulator
MMAKPRKPDTPDNWGKRVVILSNGVPVQRVPVSLARRFSQLCMAVAAEVAAQEDLTALQLGALTYLRSNSGIGQNDLAARLGIDRSNTTLILDQLEQRLLVERRVNGTDRRANLVFLTPVGVEVRERLRPKGGVAQARILEPLEPHDREKFLDMLVKIIDANEAYVRPGAARRKPKSQRAHVSKK